MAANRLVTSTLIEAIRAGNLNRVIAALDAGADLEEADIHGFAGLPLRTACFTGHVPIIRALLDRGANVNAQTADGPGAPLRLALRAGHAEIAALLLARDAEIPYDLAIAPAILERAHVLASGPDTLDIPLARPTRLTSTPQHDAPIDAEGSYGLGSNIRALDFERASGHWEKVPQAVTGSPKKTSG